jgi:hypothetical protein
MTEDNKRILKGAAIGAVLGIPLPFIGPAAGALLGGAYMAVKNKRRA